MLFTWLDPTFEVLVGLPSDGSMSALVVKGDTKSLCETPWLDGFPFYFKGGYLHPKNRIPHLIF